MINIVKIQCMSTFVLHFELKKKNTKIFRVRITNMLTILSVFFEFRFRKLQGIFEKRVK